MKLEPLGEWHPSERERERGGGGGVKLLAPLVLEDLSTGSFCASLLTHSEGGGLRALGYRRQVPSPSSSASSKGRGERGETGAEEPKEQGEREREARGEADRPAPLPMPPRQQLQPPPSASSSSSSSSSSSTALKPLPISDPTGSFSSDARHPLQVLAPHCVSRPVERSSSSSSAPLRSTECLGAVRQAGGPPSLVLWKTSGVPSDAAFRCSVAGVVPLSLSEWRCSVLCMDMNDEYIAVSTAEQAVAVFRRVPTDTEEEGEEFVPLQPTVQVPPGKTPVDFLMLLSPDHPINSAFRGHVGGGQLGGQGNQHTFLLGAHFRTQDLSLNPALSSERELVLWNLTDGQPLCTWTTLKPFAPVRRMRYWGGPSNCLLSAHFGDDTVSSNGASCISRVRMPSGLLEGGIIWERGEVLDLQVCGDAAVATFSNGVVKLWSMASLQNSNKPLWVGKHYAPVQLVRLARLGGFSFSSPSLGSASASASASVSSPPFAPLAGGAQGAEGGPSGTVSASAGGERERDMTTQQEGQALQQSGGAGAVSSSAAVHSCIGWDSSLSGGTLVVVTAGCMDRKVKIWVHPSGTCVHTLALDEMVTELAIAFESSKRTGEKGAAVFLGFADGAVSGFRVTTGALVEGLQQAKPKQARPSGVVLGGDRAGALGTSGPVSSPPSGPMQPSVPPPGGKEAHAPLPPPASAGGAAAPSGGGGTTSGAVGPPCRPTGFHLLSSSQVGGPGGGGVSVSSPFPLASGESVASPLLPVSPMPPGLPQSRPPPPSLPPASLSPYLSGGGGRGGAGPAGGGPQQGPPSAAQVSVQPQPPGRRVPGMLSVTELEAFRGRERQQQQQQQQSHQPQEMETHVRRRGGAGGLSLTASPISSLGSPPSQMVYPHPPHYSHHQQTGESITDRVTPAQIAASAHSLSTDAPRPPQSLVRRVSPAVLPPAAGGIHGGAGDAETVSQGPSSPPFPADRGRSRPLRRFMDHPDQLPLGGAGGGGGTRLRPLHPPPPPGFGLQVSSPEGPSSSPLSFMRDGGAPRAAHLIGSQGTNPPPPVDISRPSGGTVLQRPSASPAAGRGRVEMREGMEGREREQQPPPIGSPLSRSPEACSVDVELVVHPSASSSAAGGSGAPTQRRGRGGWGLSSAEREEEGQSKVEHEGREREREKGGMNDEDLRECVAVMDRALLAASEYSEEEPQAGAFWKELRGDVLACSALLCLRMGRIDEANMRCVRSSRAHPLGSALRLLKRRMAAAKDSRERERQMRAQADLEARDRPGQFSSSAAASQSMHSLSLSRSRSQSGLSHQLSSSQNPSALSHTHPQGGGSTDAIGSAPPCIPDDVDWSSSSSAILPPAGAGGGSKGGSWTGGPGSPLPLPFSGISVDAGLAGGFAGGGVTSGDRGRASSADGNRQVPPPSHPHHSGGGSVWAFAEGEGGRVAASTELRSSERVEGVLPLTASSSEAELLLAASPRPEEQADMEETEGQPSRFLLGFPEDRQRGYTQQQGGGSRAHEAHSPPEEPHAHSQTEADAEDSSWSLTIHMGDPSHMPPSSPGRGLDGGSDQMGRLHSRERVLSVGEVTERGRSFSDLHQIDGNRGERTGVQGMGIGMGSPHATIPVTPSGAYIQIQMQQQHLRTPPAASHTNFSPGAAARRRTPGSVSVSRGIFQPPPRELGGRSEEEEEDGEGREGMQAARRSRSRRRAGRDRGGSRAQSRGTTPGAAGSLGDDLETAERERPRVFRWRSLEEGEDDPLEGETEKGRHDRPLPPPPPQYHSRSRYEFTKGEGEVSQQQEQRTYPTTSRHVEEDLTAVGAGEAVGEYRDSRVSPSPRESERERRGSGMHSFSAGTARERHSEGALPLPLRPALQFPEGFDETACSSLHRSSPPPPPGRSIQTAFEEESRGPSDLSPIGPEGARERRGTEGQQSDLMQMQMHPEGPQGSSSSSAASGVVSSAPLTEIDLPSGTPPGRDTLVPLETAIPPPAADLETEEEEHTHEGDRERDIAFYFFSSSSDLQADEPEQPLSQSAPPMLISVNPPGPTSATAAGEEEEEGAGGGEGERGTDSAAAATVSLSTAVTGRVVLSASSSTAASASAQLSMSGGGVLDGPPPPSSASFVPRLHPVSFEEKEEEEEEKGDLGTDEGGFRERGSMGGASHSPPLHFDGEEKHTGPSSVKLKGKGQESDRDRSVLSPQVTASSAEIEREKEGEGRLPSTVLKEPEGEGGGETQT
uniref:Uncharacterized protein n=1 Tax=Chromera velia CCMP2878 TaxID=1169474 RepID=A0A0G4FSF6_9ALVE|eukprot:Cvel_18541.t1-p1 / transcript=Cvel_18541.t1 / gene=Cvel_18541 / organism=Chromera_velia_CCMP2878 / gene_product=hypothetical protein / transcript_product=hypothetical protein / location=Cvel_scaffold1543:10105-18947(+) / protein_length=2215 / sequence_SO=supercontig / SO=protein_coding / is_pseudo=false